MRHGSNIAAIRPLVLPWSPIAVGRHECIRPANDDEDKDDAADVARTGFKAMMKAKATW